MSFIHKEFNPMPEWLGRLHKAFTDYYGKDRIDIVESTSSDYDGCESGSVYLVVYFPHVTITRYLSNGYRDGTHDIDNLFMFVGLDLSNRCIYSGLSGLRTKFEEREVRSGYSHSHLMHINSDNCCRLNYFCTGSGPIVTTMGQLSTANNLAGIDDDVLTMFAFQLDLLVPVESQAGIPYISMNNIGRGSNSTTYRTININFDTNRLSDFFNVPIYNRFIKYLAERDYFEFFNVHDILVPGRDIATNARELSSLYIEFLHDKDIAKTDEDLRNMIHSSFIEATIDEYGRIKIPSDVRGGSIRRIGDTIITFNGTPFKLEVVPDDVESSCTLCISCDIINYINSYIFYIVNYGYRRIRNNNNEQESTEEA